MNTSAEKPSSVSFGTRCLEGIHHFIAFFTPKKKAPSAKLQGSWASLDIARIIQVVGEDPGFSAWFLHLRSLPPENRIHELSKMSEALRSNPANEDIAAILDNLQSPSIYEAFCLALEETRGTTRA